MRPVQILIYKVYCSRNAPLIMRKILTERNLIVFLFGAVLITFSLAENDTKKIEHLYTPASAIHILPTAQPTVEVLRTSTTETKETN